MVEITLSGVSHEFDGREVFRGLDFACDKPCLGIVGPNGSGKSTLLRMIAGLLTPVSGKVSVSMDGHILARDELGHLVGLSAPDARLYTELSPRENLRFFLQARGMVGGAFHPLPSPPPRMGREQVVATIPPRMAREQRIDAALDRVGLADRADDPVSELSSGLRQRAALAAALVHDPALLLLDEPMSNLDDSGAQLVRDIIDSQRKRGMVIFTATGHSDAPAADAVLDLGGAL